MKRFYVFLMMALVASFCLPQTTKAVTDIYMHGAYGDNAGTWNELGNKFTSQGNNVYTLDFVSTQDGEYRCRFVGMTDNTRWGNEMCPYANKFELTSSSYEISNYCYAAGDRKDYYFVVNMKKDKTYTFTFTYNQQGDVSKHTINVVEKENGGSGGGGSTANTNPLNGRQLTEGYYLVGNFFAYDGNTINYDAPVFKFQQQSDNSYSLYLPATLDAHAQVIKVNNLGNIVAVYGPNSVCNISNIQPLNGETFSSENLKANTGDNIKAEDGNYWNLETRRTQSDGEGQDGSYWITLTVDASNTPTSLSFKHDDNKRIAYFISTAKNGTAMAISSIRTDVNGNFNAGRYYGTMYMQEGSEYYAISNDAENNTVLGAGYNNDYGFNYRDYKAIDNSIQRPTYNKLFLWGNGGVSLSAGGESTKVYPNNGSFLAYINEGIHTVEFNSNKGKNDDETHGGMSAEIQDRTGSIVLKSVSMIGSAIPGTTTNDDSWDWTSTAGDMKWDANENCYKLSLVTTAEDGEKRFRFVGNHKEEINWHEDTVDEDAKKARTPYNSEGLGHAATASDPNETCYTTSKEHHEEDYHIIWNRPAGNWTVRFYIYTYTDAHNDPAYRYFYTITENQTLELRDLGDVTYKGATRNVLLRGDYKYFRTWSGRKNWKCDKSVDVFIVKSVGTEDAPKYQLSKVSQTTTDYTVIPANAGVVLAVKEADEEALSSVGQVIAAPSPTSYNLLRIPMGEATENIPTVGTENVLRTCVTAQNIPTYTVDETTGKKTYNYLIGFYKAKVADPENKAYTESYNDNDFLMGFWISNGNGSFYSNSAYLPVDEATAQKMNLGVTHNDYTASGAKKIPAVLFDFADIDDNNTTGIVNLVSEKQKAATSAYYTLGGQRIKKPTAGGIYIHNGKKYVVK